MTNPTEPNADAILCRNCGHPRSYHEYTSPFHCRHTDRFIAAGAATQEHECDCVTYYPLGASRSTASFKGKRDSETGELLTLRDTAPAHDVPAAQLRERLAEAERELAEAMRELAEAKEFISAYEAWANDTTVVWGSKFGELVLAFEALRAAQRPEAEGREG